MSRWFRHYAGMMRDDKLVRAALKARQTVERVVWVWGAILESAAEIDDGGRFDIDPDELAYFLRADVCDVQSVLDALEAMGRIGSGRVVKWGDRQFQSDKSAERQKRHRERQRARVECDADDVVTGVSRHGDGPEAETQTDTEPKDAASAASSASAPVLNLEEAERRCCQAAGSDRLGAFAPIAELLHRQADLERDVLPVLRSRPAGKNGIQSWRYYAPIIAEAVGKRAPETVAVGPPKVFVARDAPEWDARCREAKHSPSLTTQHTETKVEGWYFPTPSKPTRRSEAA